MNTFDSKTQAGNTVTSTRSPLTRPEAQCAINSSQNTRVGVLCTRTSRHGEVESIHELNGRPPRRVPLACPPHAVPGSKPSPPPRTHTTLVHIHTHAVPCSKPSPPRTHTTLVHIHTHSLHQLQSFSSASRSPWQQTLPAPHAHNARPHPHSLTPLQATSFSLFPPPPFPSPSCPMACPCPTGWWPCPPPRSP